MFRSPFRVVVVAVIALSLTLSLATAAQARPRDPAGPAAAAASHVGWLESVLAWVARLVGAEPLPTAKGDNRPFGSCIDPMGNGCPGG